MKRRIFTTGGTAVAAVALSATVALAGGGVSGVAKGHGQAVSEVAKAAETVSGNEKTSRNDLIGKSHVVDAEGRVLRDNVWGPQIEDAARRDFTVNAMYYDPLREIVRTQLRRLDEA